VDRLVVMGGGHAIGNVTPSAEFNFWADPEAAKIVVGAGFNDLVLVPLDATHQALISLEDCAALRALQTPAGEATAMFIEHRIRAHDSSQPMDRPGTAPVHDALCVALLLNPDVVQLAELHLDVETDGELTVGRSVIDVHHRSGKPANARVALSASPEEFIAVLLWAFTSHATV
jgi:inosine-uridine nucleoside N-ribohydrolase